jgi:hypothetical protein
LRGRSRIVGGALHAPSWNKSGIKVKPITSLLRARRPPHRKIRASSRRRCAWPAQAHAVEPEAAEGGPTSVRNVSTFLLQTVFIKGEFKQIKNIGG